MDMKEADQLGARLADLMRADHCKASKAILEPILTARIPFRYLDRIGERFAANPLSRFHPLLEWIAQEGAEGGWVIIGGALRAYMTTDLPMALQLARAYIIQADIWYGADILAERVPGPGLVDDFDPALTQLVSWRKDPNRWVRRAIGVAVHFWAKRSGGSPDLCPRVDLLLEQLMQPLFGEWEMDAAKGIGWGLKTLGKQYPDQLAAWLGEQTQRKHRAVMLNKALTYLPQGQKDAIQALM